MRDDSDVGVEKPEPAGAPAANEIEITPEMIEAGSDVVWDLKGFDPNYVAERVYLAMEAARRRIANQQR